MKKILVTGGNRGIGLEICRQLDRQGHIVILGSRDLAKGRAAASSFSGNVIVKQLDVTDEESIHNLLIFAGEAYGNLDVLINNAGLGEKAITDDNPFIDGIRGFVDRNLKGVGRMVRKSVPFLRKTGVVAPGKGAANISITGVKALMETNFYGPWRMIQAFLPLLMKSVDGRIINVSSGSGELRSLSGNYPGYSISKAALNALTIMFANELKEKGVRVNAMCPGWVKTAMGGPDAPRSVAEGADTAVWLATEKEIPTGKFFRDRNEITW